MITFKSEKMKKENKELKEKIKKLRDRVVELEINIDKQETILKTRETSIKNLIRKTEDMQLSYLKIIQSLICDLISKDEMGFEMQKEIENKKIEFGDMITLEELGL